jgi:DNA-binding cell septation regulator SpoVG
MIGAIVANVVFSPADPTARARGLLGFVAFDLVGLVRIDSVAIRLTRDGRRVLSFPGRHDRHGCRHDIVRPADDAVRKTITAAVLAALGLDAGAAATAPHRQGDSQP